jgi:hypothetical protein
MRIEDGKVTGNIKVRKIKTKPKSNCPIIK